MKRVSLRLPEQALEEVEQYESDHDVSRSQALRELVESALADERGQDVDERLQSVRAELEEKENKITELRNQLQAVNSRERDVDELVEYVEEERQLQQRREERRDAPAWTRAKWWLFGRSRKESD